MWSVHPLPVRNPAFSFVNILSIAVEIRVMMILQKTLLGSYSKVNLASCYSCEVTFLGNVYNGTFAPVIRNLSIHIFINKGKRLV